MKRGGKVILWCDGLREAKTSNSRKRKRQDSDDFESDEDSQRKSSKKKTSQPEREKRVEEAVKMLQELHGTKYTQIQYRIWAEMNTSNYHQSLETPPTNSMFVRAGNSEKPNKGKGKDASMTEAFTQMAKEISNALSPATTPRARPQVSSPGRLIDDRSKCYKQLNELNNLKSSGILSEEEYQSEKGAVMANLKLL